MNMKTRKRGAAALLAAVMVFALALSGCGQTQTSAESPTAVGGFAGGSGTAEDPYQIATAAQLTAFADSVNDGSCQGYMGQYVVLTADIDLADTTWTPIGNMSDMETHSTMFLGIFDGGNHTISNPTFETEEATVGAGLFGLSAGTIENLKVENAVVTVTDGSSQAIGGVIGYNMGTVDHVSISGASVTGNNCTGGLIGGSSGGTVTGCTAENVTVTVIGDNDFSASLVQADIAECGGLLIGGGFGGTVDNCSARGTVKASGNEPVGLGGIGGCLEMMDSVTDCTADVTIDAPLGGHAIGGLCGYAGTHSNPDVVLETEGFSTTNYPAVIDNCTVNATINSPGSTHVGGLVGTGLYYYGEETAFTITNSSVTGEINGTVTPGTIVGRAAGSKIESCTASVTADGTALTSEVGTTSCLYESADQYEAGSAEAAAQLMNALNGTYEELFPVILDAKYDDLWLNTTISCVGEENAQAYVDMLKTSMSGTVIGQKAVEAYATDSENAKFNCDFTGGVETIQFADSTITGFDAAGNKVFSHTYSFVGYDETWDFYEYKTDDTDAGEFTYFTMRSDSPAATYHIEFRYGSDLDALLNFYEGSYAYWMAAGISTDGGDAMAEESIKLFCTENLSEQ